jgi:hypothetical protein
MCVLPFLVRLWRRRNMAAYPSEDHEGKTSSNQDEISEIDFHYK